MGPSGGASLGQRHPWWTQNPKFPFLSRSWLMLPFQPMICIIGKLRTHHALESLRLLLAFWKQSFIPTSWPGMTVNSSWLLSSRLRRQTESSLRVETPPWGLEGGGCLSPYCFPPYFLREGISLNLKHTNCLDWLAATPGTYLALCPTVSCFVCVWGCFHGCWGFEPRSSHLHVNYFTSWLLLLHFKTEQAFLEQVTLWDSSTVSPKAWSTWEALGSLITYTP